MCVGVGIDEVVFLDFLIGSCDILIFCWENLLVRLVMRWLGWFLFVVVIMIMWWNLWVIWVVWLMVLVRLRLRCMVFILLCEGGL